MSVGVDSFSRAAPLTFPTLIRSELVRETLLRLSESWPGVSRRLSILDVGKQKNRILTRAVSVWTAEGCRSDKALVSLSDYFFLLFASQVDCIYLVPHLEVFGQVWFILNVPLADIVKWLIFPQIDVDRASCLRNGLTAYLGVAGNMFTFKNNGWLFIGRINIVKDRLLMMSLVARRGPQHPRILLLDHLIGWFDYLWRFRRLHHPSLLRLGIVRWHRGGVVNESALACSFSEWYGLCVKVLRAVLVHQECVQFVDHACDGFEDKAMDAIEIFHPLHLVPDKFDIRC